MEPINKNDKQTNTLTIEEANKNKYYWVKEPFKVYKITYTKNDVKVEMVQVIYKDEIYAIYEIKVTKYNEILVDTNYEIAYINYEGWHIKTKERDAWGFRWTRRLDINRELDKKIVETIKEMISKIIKKFKIKYIPVELTEPPFNF